MTKVVFDQIMAGLEEAAKTAAYEVFQSMVHNGTTIVRASHDGEKTVFVVVPNSEFYNKPDSGS